MSKWSFTSLGEVATVVSGSTPKTSIPEYWQGEYNWVTPAELSNANLVIDETERKITRKAVKETGLKPFPKGTVLLSSRAPIGKVAIAGVEMFCNQGFKNLVCSDKIYNKYLFWFLKGNTKFLNSLGRGATFKEISKTIVENIQIPLPPLEIQKQIAKTLDAAAELLAMRKQQLAELDNLIKSTFYNMFGDPVANGKGWEMHLIEDLIANGKKAIKAGPFGSALKKEFYVGQGYKIYGQEQVINNDCTYGNYYISESKYKELENYAIQENDVLISLVGTYGKILIIPKEFEKGIINPRLMKITFNKNKLNTTYFKYFFISKSVNNLLSSVSRGGTMDILNVGIVRKLPIPLPPLQLQTQFADIVTKIEEQKALVQQAINETQYLFDSLMSEYFD